MVAGWHSSAVLVATGWSAGILAVLRVFSNGHAAVTLFFVLSGLVLGGSLSRSRGAPWLVYLSFGIRRVFRICPAFWVGTCLIAAYMLWVDFPLRYPDFVSSWFAAHWQEPLGWRYFLRNFFFLDHHLNVPSWTLRAELVCSLALPILFFLSVGRNWIWRASILIGLILWSFIGHGNLSSWLFMFYLGYLIPSVGNYLVGLVRNHAWFLNSLAVAALLLLCVAMTLLASRPPWQNLLEGFSAATFISVLLYGPETRPYRILDWAPVRFYGRISYSFYLYHMVCLFVTAKTLLVVMPAAFLTANALVTSACFFALSTALATLLAWASQVWIEQTGIDFSKLLCRKLAERASAPAALKSRRAYTGQTAGEAD